MHAEETRSGGEAQWPTDHLARMRGAVLNLNTSYTNLSLGLVLHYGALKQIRIQWCTPIYDPLKQIRIQWCIPIYDPSTWKAEGEEQRKSLSHNPPFTIKENKL